MKLNVFFRLKNGQIVEVQDQINALEERKKVALAEGFEPSNFALFVNKVNEIADQEIFKDAEIIASSFGPLNI